MSDLKAAARQWLAEDPDPTTRDELRALIDRGDEAGLADRFSGRLEFGTAGLRGLLGAGPNRMNRAVVLRTTAGLCEYLREQVPDCAHRGVVVGYDGRRMSLEFARDVAAALAGAGIPAHVFTDVVPTPLVAFAVRDLNAAAGVMVTASHNPAAYNGYKVYWGNGAQIVPPHDAGIAAAMGAIGPLASIAKLNDMVARKRGLHHAIPAALGERYLAGVRALRVAGDAVGNLSVVYTALHGVGNRWAVPVLEGLGAVHSVPEQAEPDGRFPTVAFPNPEEAGALDLALALAADREADLVIANDPDADRLAVAVRHGLGYTQLTGNELGVLLGHHVITTDATAGEAAAGRMVATTIVSSPLLGVIARAEGVTCFETLTGFKWIANRAMELERSTGSRFLFGYEEALGYTVGTLVRDKDGISGAYVLAGLAATLKSQGRTLRDRLEAIYRQYGHQVSHQHNVTMTGADGMQKITDTMASLRSRPPRTLGGHPVEAVRDYHKGSRRDATGQTTPLDLPPSDVLVFELAGGSRVVARPSGTEPKIKFYFDVMGTLGEAESLVEGDARTRRVLDAIVSDFLAQVERAGGR